MLKYLVGFIQNFQQTLVCLYNWSSISEDCPQHNHMYIHVQKISTYSSCGLWSKEIHTNLITTNFLSIHVFHRFKSIFQFQILNICNLSISKKLKILDFTKLKKLFFQPFLRNWWAYSTHPQILARFGLEKRGRVKNRKRRSSSDTCSRGKKDAGITTFWIVKT